MVISNKDWLNKGLSRWTRVIVRVTLFISYGNWRVIIFRKIVVGIGGSEASEKAFALSCDLAQKYNSEVHVVHTPQPITVAFALGAVSGYHAVTTMPSDEEVEEARKNIQSPVEAIAAQYNLEITQTYMASGDPADQIIACVEECGADLIVTARRGLGSVGSLVQGSTTQRVNHLAKCACLSRFIASLICPR